MRRLFIFLLLFSGLMRGLSIDASESGDGDNSKNPIHSSGGADTSKAARSEERKVSHKSSHHDSMASSENDSVVDTVTVISAPNNTTDVEAAIGDNDL